MRSNPILLGAAALALGMISTVGCAQSPPEIEMGPNAHVTADGLHRVQHGAFESEFAKPGVDLSRYGRIMVAPVRVAYTKKYPHQAIAADDIERMRRYFKEAIVRRLSSHYPIADEPGRDVLLLEASVVNLSFQMKEEQNPETEETFEQPPAVTIVADLRDSESHEALYRMAQSLQSEASGWQMADLGTFWQDIRMSFDQWAVTLRQMLQEVVTPGGAAT